MSKRSTLVLGVACPNGIGHLRRLCLVLERLQRVARDTRVEVVCEDRQLERLRGWPVLEQLVSRPGFKIHRGVMLPGVTWETDRAAYEDGCLLAWEARLEALPSLRSADLVLSDNLAGVLRSRPDAVLQGSFLWSDVLEAAHPESAEVQEFVARERDVLATLRPPMIAVRDIAMPGVIARTQMIGVGWPCPEQPARARGPRPRHGTWGIAGGATGCTDELLLEVAGILADAPGRRVVVELEPDGWRGNPSLQTRRPLRYDELEIVVCRPGIGTLTECVRHAIPIVALYEPNAEMAHNAGRIAELGVGADLGLASGSAVREAGKTLLAEPRERLRRRFAALARTGVAESADWLAHRLGAS